MGTDIHRTVVNVSIDSLLCMTPVLTSTKLMDGKKLENHNWRKINYLMTKKIPNITARYQKYDGAYVTFNHTCCSH